MNSKINKIQNSEDPLSENEIEEFHQLCNRLSEICSELTKQFKSKWDYYPSSFFEGSSVYLVELSNTPYEIWYSLIDNFFSCFAPPEGITIKNLGDAIKHYEKYRKLIKFI